MTRIKNANAQRIDTIEMIKFFDDRNAIDTSHSYRQQLYGMDKMLYNLGYYWNESTNGYKPYDISESDLYNPKYLERRF